MDIGTLMFFARELNDKNLFITDIPVTVTGTGNDQSVSGLSPDSIRIREPLPAADCAGISVQETPSGAPVTADLADGRGADLHMFGSNLDVNISDGISVSNKLMYSAGEVDCYCLFNNFAPQTLSSFIASQITAVNANAAITTPMVSRAPAPPPWSAAERPWIRTPTWPRWDFGSCRSRSNPSPTICASPSMWRRATSSPWAGYLAAYSSDDHWWLGNNELITANAECAADQPHPQQRGECHQPGRPARGLFFHAQRELDPASTRRCSFPTSGKSTGGFSMPATASKSSATTAPSRTIPRWISTNDPRNLYNKGVSVPNGTFNQGVSCDTSGTGECTEFRHTLGSWSVGANYEITPHMAVFGRINQGVHFPGFDDLRSGTPQTQSIKNYEVGYRAQTGTFYGVVDVFHRTFTGVPYQQFTAGGQQITAVYGSTLHRREHRGRAGNPSST